jgi:hypothetical protein
MARKKSILENEGVRFFIYTFIVGVFFISFTGGIPALTIVDLKTGEFLNDDGSTPQNSVTIAHCVGGGSITVTTTNGVTTSEKRGNCANDQLSNISGLLGSIGIDVNPYLVFGVIVVFIILFSVLMFYHPNQTRMVR